MPLDEVLEYGWRPEFFAQWHPMCSVLELVEPLSVFSEVAILQWYPDSLMDMFTWPRDFVVLRWREMLEMPAPSKPKLLEVRRK